MTKRLQRPVNRKLRCQIGLSMLTAWTAWGCGDDVSPAPSVTGDAGGQASVDDGGRSIGETSAASSLRSDSTEVSSAAAASADGTSGVATRGSSASEGSGETSSRHDENSSHHDDTSSPPPIHTHVVDSTSATSDASGQTWKQSSSHETSAPVTSDSGRETSEDEGSETTDGGLDDASTGNSSEPCPSGCWIDGTCLTDGADNPSDLCTVCHASESRETWSPRCDEPTTCLESDGRAMCVCPAGFAGASCERCLMYVNHVTGDDENDGRAWSTAFETVTAALLAAASQGCEVWVAAGTYFPNPPEGNAREATFTLQPGVDLYGGFQGTEVARELRQVHDRETILSGDLQQNDNPEETTSSDDNAYHVVTGANNSRLDGFTITAGSSDYAGGGMYNVGVSPHVVNCTFQGNLAERGAAVYAIGSSSTFDECRFVNNVASTNGGAYFSYSGSEQFLATVFEGNQASAGSGGAMAVVSGADVGFNGCQFEANSAALEGGAVTVASSSLVVMNTAFSTNVASASGGAISATGQASSVSMQTSGFYYNEGSQGGALSFNSVGLVELLGVDFMSNTAQYSGGAVYFTEYAGTEALIVSSSLRYNQVTNGPGGAIFAATTALSVVNSLVYGNSLVGAYWGGAGLYAASNATVSVLSSTLTGNVTGPYGQGGAVFLDETSQLAMRNSIAWDNNASQSPEISATETDVRSSDVEGWCIPGENCTNGNISSDPLFLGESDLQLSASSPAIDVGDATLLPLDVLDVDYDADTNEPLPSDNYGNGRVHGTALDLGALEFHPD